MLLVGAVGSALLTIENDSPNHSQKLPEMNIFNTEPGTVLYYMRGGLHVSTIWEMAFIGCHTFTVSGSMSIVLTISAAFLVFVSSFFPPFPKTSQNKKQTIKTPSKFPIPQKSPTKTNQKKTSAIFVAQLVQNRMNFLDDASGADFGRRWGRFSVDSWKKLWEHHL